jgi:hypothetical protein
VDWAELYEQGQDLNLSTENEASRQEFKALLIRRQAEFMPQLRQAYAQSAARAVWRENVEVSVSGAGNRRITFVGGLFASNANVEDAHLAIFHTLRLLRFNEAQYRWIPRGGRYVRYSIEHDPANGAGNDRDLMVRSFPGRDFDSYDLLEPVSETTTAP